MGFVWGYFVVKFWDLYVDILGLNLGFICGYFRVKFLDLYVNILGLKFVFFIKCFEFNFDWYCLYLVGFLKVVVLI